MWKHALGLLIAMTAAQGLALGQNYLGSGAAGTPNTGTAGYGSTGAYQTNPSPYRTYQTDATATPGTAPATVTVPANGGQQGCCSADRCLHGWFNVEYMMLFP